MPFIKNISLQSKKIQDTFELMTVSLSSTATGSSGYFTSSNGVLYTGATVTTPSDITYTLTRDGGAPPYRIEWSSSLAYASGYPDGDNLSSFTLSTYAGEQDRWTVKVTDSSTPPVTVSASIDTIVFGDDPPALNVDPNGSDTPAFQTTEIYGSTAAPLQTINAAIKYAVPTETTIQVASGTYGENPIINKNIFRITGVSGTSLSSSNYFIYDSKSLPSSNVRNNVILGFSSSSFSTIGVTPSGSLQTAINDAGLVTGSSIVYALGGVHEISTPLSSSNNPDVGLILRGVHVPTGSSDTYIYQPQTILRMTNINDSMIHHIPNSGPPVINTYNNLALEINTGSFFTVQNGSSRNGLLEMISFRYITSSIAQDMLSAHIQSFIGNTNIIEERNILRYIFDSRELGYGSGTFYNDVYSPYFWELGGQYSASIYEGNFHSNPSIQGVDVLTLYGVSGLDPAGGTLTSRQPNSFFGTASLFNGLTHLKWNGTAEYTERNIETFNTPSVSVFLVFSLQSNTATDRVLYKHGDSNSGWSFAQRNTSFSVNFYTSGSGVVSTAFITGSGLVAGQQYLAEIFFNGNSTSKRVGMALYSTSSLITSSYFSSTDFPPTTVYSPPQGAGSVLSFGCRSGFLRYMRPETGPLQILTSIGRSLWFDGRIASVGIFLDPSSSKDTRCNAHYNYLRRKYFPTGSIVQRAISSDT